jgi:type IV pilus assembly protein PilX
MKHSCHVRAPRRQGGAILVTSLLLLLVLTVLGIAMMKMTNMQDRMAGNTRDLSLAFQGAEAALRAGEAQVRTIVAEPGNLPTQASVNCALCEAGVLPVDIDDPAAFDWPADGIVAPGINPPSGSAGHLAEDPQYKVEHSAWVSDQLGTGVNGDDTGRDYFTITGRSTGASGDANTVLQSTYARRF